jgi:hypothetical protein
MQKTDNIFVSEKNFKTFHLTTTKCCGNMKNAVDRDSFCNHIAIDGKNIVFANQVHGISVKKVSSADCGKFMDNCDGLITDDKNIFLCIFTADCMPVFMASKDYSVVAMIHAGWRGLAGGIIESALTKFVKDFSVNPCDIVAYVGPHILRCCYRVGDELKKAFHVSSDEEYFSLSNEAETQMRKTGIKKVYLSPHCSCHEKETFFSYRRDKTANRMMSLIKCS